MGDKKLTGFFIERVHGEDSSESGLDRSHDGQCKVLSEGIIADKNDGGGHAFFISADHERTKIHHGFAFEKLGIVDEKDRIKTVGRAGELKQVLLQTDQKRNTASGGIDTEPVGNGPKQTGAIEACVMEHYRLVDIRIERPGNVCNQGGFPSP